MLLKLLMMMLLLAMLEMSLLPLARTGGLQIEQSAPHRCQQQHRQLVMLALDQL
jgi:hypothetical protein